MTTWSRCTVKAIVCVTAMAVAPIATAGAPAEASDLRQSLDDAWWTGPLLAASPGTLPQGHFLVEPYLYDSIAVGRYDGAGTRQSTNHESNFGSQAYVFYGLTDTTTIGMIPRFGFRGPSQVAGRSGIGVGDVTVQAAHRLTQFQDAGWLPATSLLVAETLPIGKYDRLGSRPGDGLGGGAFTTALSINSQYYFLMPNGRILRARLDVTHSWSGDVPLKDVSVYGTPDGFRGHASPGNSSVVNLAFEYSVTRNWVAALDVIYEYDNSTRVAGQYRQQNGNAITPVDVAIESGSSRSRAMAPAVEYNWTSNVGIIVGAKIIAAGRNTTATVIPVMAVNMVF